MRDAAVMPNMQPLVYSASPAPNAPDCTLHALHPHAKDNRCSAPMTNIFGVHILIMYTHAQAVMEAAACMHVCVYICCALCLIMIRYGCCGDADEVDAVADECARCIHGGVCLVYMQGVVAPRPLGQSPCLRNSFMVAGNHGFVIVHISAARYIYICRERTERDMYYRQPEREFWYMHADIHTIIMHPRPLASSFDLCACVCSPP